MITFDADPIIPKTANDVWFFEPELREVKLYGLTPTATLATIPCKQQIRGSEVYNAIFNSDTHNIQTSYHIVAGVPMPEIIALDDAELSPYYGWQLNIKYATDHVISRHALSSYPTRGMLLFSDPEQRHYYVRPKLALMIATYTTNVLNNTTLEHVLIIPFINVNYRLAELFNYIDNQVSLDTIRSYPSIQYTANIKTIIPVYSLQDWAQLPYANYQIIDAILDLDFTMLNQIFIDAYMRDLELVMRELQADAPKILSTLSTQRLRIDLLGTTMGLEQHLLDMFYRNGVALHHNVLLQAETRLQQYASELTAYINNKLTTKAINPIITLKN